METKTHNYIIDELKNRVTRYNFYMRVNECAVPVLKEYIGKKLTKREAQKILNEVQKTYPEAVLYWQKEKWSTDCDFRLPSFRDCRSDVAVNSMQDDCYTPYLHERNEEKLKYSIEHYNNATAQLDNINELIGLHEKQETEIKELQARQQLERDIFSKQAKCPDTDISSLIEAAQKRIDRENYEAYHAEREKEFNARRQAARKNEDNQPINIKVTEI